MYFYVLTWRFFAAANLMWRAWCNPFDFDFPTTTE